MSRPVFISYSRGASAAHAQALAARLGDPAFLDTGAIDDGTSFLNACSTAFSTHPSW
jgi:hypothetical protein